MRKENVTFSSLTTDVIPDFFGERPLVVNGANCWERNLLTHSNIHIDIQAAKNEFSKFSDEKLCFAKMLQPTRIADFYKISILS